MKQVVQSALQTAGAAGRSRRWCRWGSVVASVLMGWAALGQANYTNNFNQANDTGLSHYDPLASYTSGAMSSAAWTFPADPSGGNRYRIQAFKLPDPQLGPARAFSYLAGGNYGRFVASVDVVDWDNTIDESFGILFRAAGVGLQATSGYVVNFTPDAEELQMYTVVNEGPGTVLSGVQLAAKPESGPYRLVASGWGSTFAGQVFGPASSVVPIA